MSIDLKNILGDVGRAAVAEGRYSLMLGAGASFAATSKDGRPLPLGDAYGKELVEKYGLSINQGTSLQHIWDAAAHRAGSEAALRAGSLEPRFADCVPAEYQKLFSTFAWRRIFTVNVDDSLAGAYASTKSRLQEVQEVHFEDLYSEVNLSNDEVQLVYLHGAAAQRDRAVVFSPPAYADVVAGQKTWFHVFAESFLSDPFFVIGASLREADFETYLAQKKRFPNPLAPPSLYVSPDIDDAAKAICHRLGLTPVQMTGEEFLRALGEAIGHREKLSTKLARSLQSFSILKGVENLSALAAVAEQFVVLSRDPEGWPKTERGREALYEGFDASWDDIRTSNDVALAFEAGLAAEIRKFMDSDASPNTQVTVISDSAGTGKTTVAMRVAATLAMEDRNVLYLTSAERLRDEALKTALLKQKSPVLIVVDRLISHSLQVVRLLADYPKGAPRCFILGVERRLHEHTLRERLADSKPSFRQVPNLSTSEAEELARKLRLVAKLGSRAGQSDRELGALFTSTAGQAWAGQLLVILLELTQEKRLADRLLEEWRGLSHDGKRFYGAICVAAACGYPLRSARAYSTLPVASAADFARQTVEGVLRGLTQWEFNGGDYFIRPKHRVIAEEVLKTCMTPDEVFEISQAIALALAPYVNRKTIMSGSSDARLLRELMNEDGQVVPLFHQRADEWYASLQKQCEWNSRYWEQRALSAMRHRNHRRARDFASTGIGIERHQQPLTTYARVFLDSAEHDTTVSKVQRETFFAEALGVLGEAIDESVRRRRNDVHPYHLLLVTAVRVSQRLHGRVTDELRDAIRRHASHAAQVLLYEPEIKKALDALQRMGVL